MASPILWQDEQQDIYLMDIPRSIEAAAKASKNRHLQSTSPLEEPFPTNEPKSASAKARVQKQDVDGNLHEEYQNVLGSALGSIRGGHSAAWCLPRPYTAQVAPRTKKRKLEQQEDEDETTLRVENGNDPGDMIRTLAATPAEAIPTVALNFDPESDAIALGSRENSLTNRSSQSTSFNLTRGTKPDDNSYNFTVPPGASLYLGDCAHPGDFRSSVHQQAKLTCNPAQFDFIVLDPPWPNSSVKRTHHTPGSTYETSPSMWDMRELLLDTEIDHMMADDCIIGIWVTNKPAVRQLVLGEDGLFENWDVELLEEWIWLKTTVHGEPVTPLDAIWRKPYEVLLLGRKRSKAPTQTVRETEIMDVKRRVIAAVPDLHSRKPCLKELLEQLLLGSREYRALEVFARYLVSGWWSWGNECIKFNWDGYWREENESGERAAAESD